MNASSSTDVQRSPPLSLHENGAEAKQGEEECQRKESGAHRPQAQLEIAERMAHRP